MEQSVIVWDKGKPLSLYPINEWGALEEDESKEVYFANYHPQNIIQLATRTQETLPELGFFLFCMN